jgi:Mg2+ and Co2+ transporter CorA
VTTVRFLGADGATEHGVDDLPELLRRTDGFVWVDVPRAEDAEPVLRDVFGCRPAAVKLCVERNHIPQVQTFPEHVVLVLLVPERGEAGHVHLLELDQVVAERAIVTVHGPLNPVVPLEAALSETASVWHAIKSGKLHPQSPAELSHAISSAVARRQQAFVSGMAGFVAELETSVMSSDFRKPELLLDELFLLRHELLVVRTMAEQSHHVFGRVQALTDQLPGDAGRFAADLADQFHRVRSMADGEKDFLFGVLEFYQSRISTKMTIASERLAVLAVLTLPITAIASIYGMNFEHMPELSKAWAYPLTLCVMAAIVTILLRWAKRQGWW